MICPKCDKELELRFAGLYVEIWWCEACEDHYEKQIGENENVEQKCHIPSGEEVL